MNTSSFKDAIFHRKGTVTEVCTYPRVQAPHAESPCCLKYKIGNYWLFLVIGCYSQAVNGRTKNQWYRIYNDSFARNNNTESNIAPNYKCLQDKLCFSLPEITVVNISDKIQNSHIALTARNKLFIGIEIHQL